MSRFVALIAALAAACTASETNVGAKAALPDDTAGPQSAPAASSLSDEDRKVVELADAIQADVEKIHGLEFRSPVKKGVYDRERLAKFLQKELEKEGHEKLRTEQRTLQLFGLLPAKYDLEKEM